MKLQQTKMSIFVIVSESYYSPHCSHEALLGVAFSKDVAIEKALKYSRNAYEDDENSDDEDEQNGISMLKYPILVHEMDADTDVTLSELEVRGEGMVYDLACHDNPNLPATAAGEDKPPLQCEQYGRGPLIKEKTTGIILEQKGELVLVFGKDINGTMVLITDEQFTQEDIDFCLVNNLTLPESTTIKSAGKV